MTDHAAEAARSAAAILASDLGASALVTRHDDQHNDDQDRSGGKYQHHREDVLQDPVPAGYPLPFLRRQPEPRRMEARGRVVQHERLPPLTSPRAADPNHGASRLLPGV